MEKKLQERNIAVDENRDVALGICFGTGIGIVVGAVLGNVTFGLSFGGVVGILAAVGRMAYKKFFS
jgi:hypothetical protein